MACFITPLVTGIVIKLIKRIWKNSVNYRLDILEIMLITGAVILAIEHLWHGELVPYPPFLTAMQNPYDLSGLLSEISIVGSSMTATVVLAWFSITAFNNRVKLKQSMHKVLKNVIR